MPALGKPDATGRSSGKMNGRSGKILGPPKDDPWVWLTAELLSSDAWRLRSRQCVLLIDALLIEHMAHSGQENGRLMATYDQLEARGARRMSLRQTIKEAEYLGLLRVTKHGGRWAMTNEASRYRITFLPTIENGIACKPTNDWRKRSARQIGQWHKRRLEKKKAKTAQKKQ